MSAHTDCMYVWVAARFYFLLSFVDAYSRHMVHHKLLISLDGQSVAIELQAALEAVKDARPQNQQPDRYQDSTAAPRIERHRGALQRHYAASPLPVQGFLVGDLHGDFNLIADDAQWMSNQRLRRRCTQRAAVPNIKRGAV
jgi:hypothetical protein